MKIAAGILGILGGIFGSIAAFATLFLGGVGGAFGAEGASTVVGLGWGGLLFSIISIVFGALAFGKLRVAGYGLVISSILGGILGGTLVAICMIFPLVGGILALVGSRMEKSSESKVSEKETSHATEAKEPVKNAEDYGLKKKLSVWNVHKVKNPELYGGYSNWTFRLLGLLSLGWIIGLVLYLTNFKSTSVVKTYQAKHFLLCAAIGFVIMLGMIVGNGNEAKQSNIKEIGKVKVEEPKKGTKSITQNNYNSDREREKSREDCVRRALVSIVGKTFTATPDQRPIRTGVGWVSGFKFYDSPKFGPGFNVKKPEKFAVVRCIETEKSEFLTASSVWYEVKFESGKVGYLTASNFYSLSDGPDVYKEAEDCF
jgi:hypothetical protein